MKGSKLKKKFVDMLKKLDKRNFLKERKKI